MGMNPEFSLLLAMICSASMALALRLFRPEGNNRYGIILGNYLTCTLTGFLFVSNKAAILHAHPATYICGLAAGFLFVLSLVCMQTSISRNGAILSSAFSKLGLLVPLALSLLLFHERPGLLQIIGLLVVLVSIRFFSGSQNMDEPAADISLLLLLAVLFTNGMSDSMAKIYSTYGVLNEEPVYFFVLFLVASLVTLCLLVHERKTNGNKLSLRDLAAGILVGIPNYFSSVLLLKALNGIPAFIVYPVFSSGTILIVTLVSSLFFHEKLNRRQLTGLVLVLISIIFLNLS
ncbi:MAG: DMT family transporter [Erysipelotrichaceae bacterium]|nr:DMT family transporter [Erysipelotrichaceae bacterium]